MTEPPGGRRLTVLFAPDSFKGSLTSVEVARALAAGWARARPADELLLAPLADGGEGTLVAIEAAGGWEWQSTEVLDPLGRVIRARWLRSTDRMGAVVEMAEASGLSRVRPEERDPIGATSYGLGDLICDVAASGVQDVIIGIGGSATTDGGFGMLASLSMDWSPNPQHPPRGIPADVSEVWLHDLDADLARIRVSLACDVTNPLLGLSGAAATYGPQKGATPDQVEILEARLARFADALEHLTKPRRTRDDPGAGAAGGVGFALMSIQDSFEGFVSRPGVDLVMEATGFEEKLGRADVVITGEGRIDAQTAFGKTALGVARRASARGVRCIAVGGGVTPEGIEALRALATVVAVHEDPIAVEDAIAAGAAPLERCGERIASLVSIGMPA